MEVIFRLKVRKEHNPPIFKEGLPPGVLVERAVKFNANDGAESWKDDIVLSKVVLDYSEEFMRRFIEVDILDESEAVSKTIQLTPESLREILRQYEDVKYDYNTSQQAQHAFVQDFFIKENDND